MRRRATFTVRVETEVAPDKAEVWDDTFDILRAALESIALDNTEYHFPDVKVWVE